MKCSSPVGGAPRVWITGDVTSCLDVAHDMAAGGRLQVWESLIAESQSAGRGQLRRTWVSPPGNLYAALRLPVEPPFDGPAASVAAGALVVGALRASGLPTWLKWPNDLVFTQGGLARKFGGILLEERQEILLAGVGINITSSPETSMLRPGAAVPALCLAEFTASPPLAENLWRQLVNRAYSMYTADSKFSVHWRQDAEEFLLWRHRLVALTDEQGTLCGELVGLASSGAVCLSVDGKKRDFFGGSLHLP